jgi:hypothetical protein
LRDSRGYGMVEWLKKDFEVKKLNYRNIEDYEEFGIT